MTFRDKLRTNVAPRCREERSAEPAPRLVGTLRRVLQGRPFAFIRCDSGEEYFADRREVEDPALWRDGARVSFIPSVARCAPATRSTRHDHRPPAWHIVEVPPEPAPAAKPRTCRARKSTPVASSQEPNHAD